MPTRTATATGNETFYSTYSSRSAASGTNFTTDLATGLPGAPHYGDTTRCLYGFVFTLENVPQGSIVNSVKARFRVNNGWGTDAAQRDAMSRGYLAVENNLDPKGTGAVVNGTLGSQPWQRISRQSAATTLLGARCGPTHSGDLATTGVSVRDTSAYVYKLHVPDANQGSATASATEVTFGSWFYSCDFSAALQALVDDPGWDSVSQDVLVWAWGDDDTGTTFGGSLASIAWASGTVGSSLTYNNVGGQTYTNTNPPELHLDFTSVSLASSGGSSSALSRARLRPSHCWARWRGERVEALVGNPALPRWSSGAHDLPPTGSVGTVNPFDAAWLAGNPVGARLKHDSPRFGRLDGRCLWVEDYAGAQPGVFWDVDRYQEDYPSLTTYSGRFYHRYDRDAIIGSNPRLVTFYRWDGAAWVTSFQLEHQAFTIGTPDTSMKLRITWPVGQSTAWSSYEFIPRANTFYRYELQVDEASSPKVTVRCYTNDSTTPVAVLTADPTSVECGRMEFRDFQTDAIYFFSFRIHDLEMWTDYDLGGQFPTPVDNATGTPYIPQPIAWYEWDGSAAAALDDLGEVTAINPDGSGVVLDGVALDQEDDLGTPWVGTSGQGWASKTTYSVQTGRQVDVYLPPGTAPDGGWPCLMYHHGGFWVSGDKDGALEKDSFVNWAMVNGFAVASGSYVLGQVTFNPYPAWNPAAATGRYPTFLLDYKLVSRYVQDRALGTGTGELPINGDKLVAVGHSAGGKNALDAAFTSGLTVDGAGRAITLAGNQGSFGYPNLPDPVFAAAVSLAGPINLVALSAYDPSDPDYPFGGSGKGSVRCTAALYQGYPITNNTSPTDMSVDDFVRLNAANLVPTFYAYGGGDYLVCSLPVAGEYNQALILQQAWDDTAGTRPPGATLTVVEMTDAMHHTIQGQDCDYDRLWHWLRSTLGV